MNETDQKAVTVDDFNAICRVCLQNEEHMIDIFESGVVNHMMEVTTLKVEPNDKLPKALCRKCNHQINELSRFLQKAKTSDSYLRSLLSRYESPMDIDSKAAESLILTNKKFLSKKSKKQKLNKKIIKKVNNESESDKMFLIFVPETHSGECEKNSEIFIKDLSSENDNLGLTDYCKHLIKNYFSDHTYLEKQENCSGEDHQIEVFKSISFSQSQQDDKTYAVNLLVYECTDCQAAFEELEDLTVHLSNHKVKPSFLKKDYCCPVCDFSVEERSIFMDHIKIHRETGYFFVKINAAGEIIPPQEIEKDLFIEAFPKQKVCVVFSLNLDSLKCTLCSENIKSKSNILKHLEYCLSKNKLDIKFNVHYTCPVCCKLFIDEEKNFIQHLSFHKEKNNYFIQVDSSGEPVKITSNDKLFVPFKEAVKIFCNKSTIFEIVDINSCSKCDYTSENFNELYEHSYNLHSETLSSEISFCCPVCSEEFKGVCADEEQVKFYEHLKSHKNGKVSFILVKKNGTMSDLKKKYSDVFTQSQFLWSLINASSLFFQNISPELVLLNHKSKYTCDICQEKFKNKQEINLHLKSHQVQEVLQDNVNYICEKCGKKCSGKINYKKHFLKHSMILSTICRRPTCTICNKKFANRNTLNGHMTHHFKEQSGNDFNISLLGIICEKCGRNFSNNASLTKHKKVHSKEKESMVLKCEICDRDFFRQSSFERHKSAHLNPKYFECGVCKLPLSSVTSLEKHSEIHKNGSNTFDCKACQLSFLTRDSLSAHQTHTGHYLDRRPLECNVCHEKFFISRKFTEHIKTHPKYKMGECTLCGKRLSTTQSLMLHMGRHFESNSILCPHCGKQFFEERNYHRHLLTHEGVKPYSCDTEGCKKSFYTLFELNRHKKYHNNTRDFRCPYCSKSFYEANHLTVHVRTHTGERPYICPHCNKGFVTRTHCKHHIKLMHQGVGYELIRSNISKKVTVFEAVETVA